MWGKVNVAFTSLCVEIGNHFPPLGAVGLISAITLVPLPETLGRKRERERGKGSYLTERLIRTKASLGILALRKKEYDKERGEEMKPVGV